MELYANPYSGGRGFYFKTLEQFEAGMASMAKRGIEEVEIDLIDGTSLESALFSACEPTQSEMADWFDLIEDFGTDEQEAAKLYFEVAHQGANWRTVDLDDTHVLEGTLEDYAQWLIDEVGLPPGTDYFDEEAFGESIRDEIVEAEVNQAREDAAEDGPDAQLRAEEKVRKFYDRREGFRIAEDYLIDMYGEKYANKLPEELRKQWFDLEAFAQDLDLNGEVREFEFAGKTWTAETH